MREEGADTIHTTVQRLVFIMKMKLNKMNTFSFLPTCSTLWIPAACFFFFFSFLFFQPRRVRCARSPLLSSPLSTVTSVLACPDVTRNVKQETRMCCA